MDDDCMKWGEQEVLSREGVVTGLNDTFNPRAKVKRGVNIHTTFWGASLRGQNGVRPPLPSCIQATILNHNPVKLALA